jgi:hypothetical protein
VSTATKLRQMATQLNQMAETLETKPEAVLKIDGPALRPHTIKGWWQVWSGYLCIALLTPEDIKPLQMTDRLERVDREVDERRRRRAEDDVEKNAARMRAREV